MRASPHLYNPDAPSGPGFALPSETLWKHAFKSGQKPLWIPISPKSVRDAEAKYGWGSAEHQQALQQAGRARDAYVRGETWPVVAERPSPQERLFYRREFEVLIGGAKGGAKTAACMMWMISGNPFAPLYDTRGQPILHNLHYVFHPKFAGLVLRLTEKDLDEWVREAEPLYKQLGGRWVGRPAGMFRFDSGAVIYTGHLDDERSYLKYWGKSIIRIIVEELTHISDEKTYRMIRTCCRSPVPEMVAQIRCTTNPLPMAPWVFDYFIEPKQRNERGELDTAKPVVDKDGVPVRYFDDQGVPVYPEPTVEEEGVNPFTGKRGVLTRTFIPARLEDNPHLLHNDQYVMTLATLPPDERDALLLGKWSSQVGAYFKLFRPRGPIVELHEPVNANHVVHVPRAEHTALKAGAHELRYRAKPLEPWWFRWMSGDWGHEHDAAFHWYCHCPDDDSIQVFNERGFQQTIPEEVGFEIARESVDMLNGMARYDLQPSLTLYIGMDIEQDRIGGGRTVMELLAAGIARVLGRNRVHTPDFEIKFMQELAWEQGQQIDQEAVERIRTQTRAGITIRRAPNQRVVGWQYIMSMLRWWPMSSNAYRDFDPVVAYQTLAMEDDEAYQSYMNKCLRAGQEVLPKLQIWRDQCPRVIDALPKFQRSETRPEDCDKRHFHGMDYGDSLRYGLMGFRGEQHREPKLAYLDRRMGEVNAHMPTMNAADRIRTHQALEREWQQSHVPLLVKPVVGARAARVALAQAAGVVAGPTDRAVARPVLRPGRGHIPLAYIQRPPPRLR